jgi:hypothetical protein
VLLKVDEKDTHESARFLAGCLAVEKKRNIRRKGDAKLLLEATLDHLIASGPWGKTDQEIYDFADVSRGTFYKYLREEGSIKNKFNEYRRKSTGRGPAKPAEV